MTIKQLEAYEKRPDGLSGIPCMCKCGDDIARSSEAIIWIDQAKDNVKVWRASCYFKVIMKQR